MNKVGTQSILLGASSTLVYLFGPFDLAMQALCLLIVLDYITGIMVGYVKKELSSKIGIIGIFKKVAILLTVVVAFAIDKAMGTDWLRDAIILCLCGNEGISFLENISLLGVPIPQKLLDSLLQLKGNGDGDNIDKGDEDDAEQ